MKFLSKSPPQRKPEQLSPSSSGTVSDGGWRRWWQAESHRAGFDWPSVVALHLSIADSLRRSS
jgi:hypothetical protein